MDDPALWHRLQFAFSVTYHYLFPQLTMGLVWFLVYWKWRAYRRGDEQAAAAARFWARIFGLNFAVGVVTGIPMEFQFGTNWAGFSKYSGGVIGQTLAMEGMFAFLLESAFVGALVFGEKRLGPRRLGHVRDGSTLLRLGRQQVEIEGLRIPHPHACKLRRSKPCLAAQASAKSKRQGGQGCGSAGECDGHRSVVSGE